jgi:hypothetical protein
VVASVSILGTCYISGASSINLGNTLYPTGGALTGVAFTVNDPGGNAPANILISATGNWISPADPANSIFYGNVFWNPTSVGLGLGNALTTSPVNTLIQVPAPSQSTPTTNNIVYFGITIPGAQPAGLYTSNIVFQNSCQPSNSIPLTVPTTANVVGTCYISLPSSISFGSVNPGSNTDTNVIVTDNDINGNVAANVLVDGTTWVAGANSFGVSNTVWDAASQPSFTGNALTNALVLTPIVVPAPSLGTPTTSNNIYFGVGIPQGTVAGSYTQNILIENSC